MVCPRCIKVIRDEFAKLGIEIKSIVLGEVETILPIEELPIDKIKEMLAENGFELIDDKNSRIIEKIKNVVISVIQEYEGEDIEKIINYGTNVLISITFYELYWITEGK